MSRLAPLLIVAVLSQTATYRAEVEKFRADREVEIGGENGWASLAGLHWLTTGRHTVGRDAANDVVLTAPSAPSRLGTLIVSAVGATLEITPGVDARVGGKAATTVDLHPNVPASAGVTVGHMTMVLIKRGERFALRVWDRDSEPRKNFHGLKWYPIDPAWRIDAEFVPHAPAPKVKILNVLNEAVEMTNPGAAVFHVGGAEYRLEALLESDDAKELFFIFKDGTNGTATYGAGRYLYTPLPKDGHVTLDFNEADNPPCAFTAFATCPLSPASNRLTLAIPAGELVSQLHRD